MLSPSRARGSYHLLRLYDLQELLARATIYVLLRPERHSELDGPKLLHLEHILSFIIILIISEDPEISARIAG